MEATLRPAPPASPHIARLPRSVNELRRIREPVALLARGVSHA
jgi:hypothetical protein